MLPENMRLWIYVQFTLLPSRLSADLSPARYLEKSILYKIITRQRRAGLGRTGSTERVQVHTEHGPMQCAHTSMTARPTRPGCEPPLCCLVQRCFRLQVIPLFRVCTRLGHKKEAGLVNKRHTVSWD